MKVTKSLLLGSAAALLMGGAAKAADLPVRKAAPRGLRPRLRLHRSGLLLYPRHRHLHRDRLVRPHRGRFHQCFADADPDPRRQYGGRIARDRPGSRPRRIGFLARTRTYLDTRTQTAYGTVRAYIQYQIDRDTGIYGASGLATGATAPGGIATSNSQLRRGFNQFAGITAGRVQSFFDFYADNYNYEGIANSDVNNNVLAYTYTAGGGFSATLSIEDRATRNLSQNVGNIIGGTSGVASAAHYAGETIPDIVGVLRYDQTWVQPSSRRPTTRFRRPRVSSPVPEARVTPGLTRMGSRSGRFAHQAADARRRRRPLARGCLSERCLPLQDSASFMNAGFSTSAVGGFQHVDRDAIAIPHARRGSGQLQPAVGRGLQRHAGLQPLLHPELPRRDLRLLRADVLRPRQELRLDHRWSRRCGANIASATSSLWDPVKNLEIGLEVDYLHIDQTLAHNVGVAATALPVGVQQNPSNYEARLRIERDF